MQPETNYLKYSVLGTLMLIVALGALYLIPAFDIGEFHFKRINLLSDVMVKPKPIQVAVAKDTTVFIKPVYVDTCKHGITCIEDYSPDTTGLYAFLSALDSSGSKLVRIAYFADSYVEGDIMLDPLRDTLQATFGGSGVGFVPITSEVAGFRQTVRHQYENWQIYSVMGSKSPQHPLGPAGYTAAPEAENNVTYKATNKRRLNNFTTAQLFFGNTEGSAVVVNGTDTIYTGKTHTISKAKLGDNLKAVNIHVPADTSVDLYGVSFEDTKGISLDNFSMRGNSGIGLASVQEQMYRNFDSIHHYNLVVLAYGLNVASPKAKNYDWYARSMNNVVKMMKRAFPNSSILLVGCSDRGAKVDEDLQTMPMLKELIDVQRKIAADNGVCFWNLFEAMGGDSTMVKWADTKPVMADKDYTHLTFYGGRKIAGILMGTLMYEKEKFDRKRKSI